MPERLPVSGNPDPKGMKRIMPMIGALIAGFGGGVLGTMVIKTREEIQPAQVVRWHGKRRVIPQYR